MLWRSKKSGAVLEEGDAGAGVLMWRGAI